MLRHYELIDDTSIYGCLRYDYAIKNRRNSNMELFLRELNEYTNIFEKNKEILDNLLKMQITSDPQYAKASLYHIGLVYCQNTIDIIKFYFFTRWCSDPENPNIDRNYRDQYFIEFLDQCGVEEYKQLIRMVKPIIKKTRSHLWMIGFDCSILQRKYKIYIKNVQFNAIQDIFRESTIDDEIINQVEEIDMWMKKHPQYCLDGIALGLNSHGNLSVNFYFS